MVHCLLRGRDGGGRGDGNNWMGCNDGAEEEKKEGGSLAWTLYAPSEPF